jgi:multidrug efflux pump subunit AcrB
MKKILSAFVKYPFYGKIVIIVLLLVGGISLLNMKKAIFPIIETRVINITVVYPGATPQEMEHGVTSLIEEGIRGIAGIKEFTSQSRENISIVTVAGRNGHDVDELLTDIKNSVDGISNFPASAEKPIVSKQRSMDMAAYLSLMIDGADMLQLNEAANRIEDDLLASGLISQVSILGIPGKMEISVEIDETQLRRYGIGFVDIQNAINSNNQDIHGGTIRNPREEILVLSRNRSTDPEEIKNIVIKAGQNGQMVRVGDVADVKLQFEESPNESYVDGERNVTIFIQKLESEDLQEISAFITDYIEEYNKKYDDREIIVLMDFLEMIDSQLSILISNGALGVLLVIIMLSLLLNYRLSFWVAWGIPASFLGMFIVASMMGLTLNFISLFGMILIIGILVDDGIVIGENIFTHHEMGKSPRLAAIDGTMEVLPAVFTSLATTIIAFTPLLFIEGNLEMMKEMAIVVIFALLFSLFEGIFVLPGHLVSHGALKPVKKKSAYGKVRGVAERAINWLRESAYIPALKWTLKHKAITLGIVISLFVITIGLFAGGKIPFTFFPDTPGDIFNVDLALKPGTNKEITKEKLFWLDDLIWEVNEELMDEHPEDTISYITFTQVGIGNAFDGVESGSNAGGVTVFLNDQISETEVNDRLIQRRIAEKAGPMKDAYKYGVGASHRFGAPVSISLLGYDLEELEDAKEELKSELGKMSSLYNIIDNSQLGSQEIRISLKQEAYALGLTHSSLMNQVRSGYYGALAQRMQEGKNEIWIYVRYPIENRENIGQLENMMITTSSGAYPLYQLADFENERSLNKINRYNGRREVRVDAYLKDTDEPVPPILASIEENILPGIIENYPSITYMHQGQQKDTDEEMASMGKYFGIAFLIMVLIIMIYFKSFKQGLIVLVMIPFGVLGAIWGHGFHGVPLSLMSIWGVIALTGTIINDAIVFMAKFNQNMKRGMKLVEATIDAGRKRFRAILLTTITTTVGLMPLILESSADAGFIIPMAISLAYGILFGTLFILFLLPHLILMSNSINIFFKRVFKGQRLDPEMVEVAVINQQIETVFENNREKYLDSGLE